MNRADIGVVGGSGLYELFRDDTPELIPVATPYGDPSDRVAIGLIDGHRVAFLPRHGSHHTVPPHRINYRANIWALQSLGVTRVIAPCAVGSLRADVGPGDVVLCDQFIDHTRGRREDTFFDGPAVAHLSAPWPYCEELRALAATACHNAGMTAHDAGTVVVIDGPRFATIAESRMLAATGATVINMTQYPEVALARELGLCYVALCLVTDYDAGFDGDPHVKPVTQEDVLTVFARNIAKLRESIVQLVTTMSSERRCSCNSGPPQRIDH